MKFAALLAAAVLLAACQPTEAPQRAGDKDFGAEGRACIADGGTPGRGGLSPFMVCYKDMPDAGKACARASDCEGICMVDYKTDRGQCSARTPVFGCYEYFGPKGERVEICVD